MCQNLLVRLAATALNALVQVALCILHFFVSALQHSGWF